MLPWPQTPHFVVDHIGEIHPRKLLRLQLKTYSNMYINSLILLVKFLAMHHGMFGEIWLIFVQKRGLISMDSGISKGSTWWSNHLTREGGCSFRKSTKTHPPKKWHAERWTNWPKKQNLLDESSIISWMELSRVVFIFPNMDVSKTNGTMVPKSSILIGFSIIFTIHCGGKIPLFLETTILWGFLGVKKRHVLWSWAKHGKTMGSLMTAFCARCGISKVALCWFSISRLKSLRTLFNTWYCYVVVVVMVVVEMVRVVLTKG